MNNQLAAQDAELVAVVCAVLIDHTDQFLVAKRPLGGRLGGLWEFPGGKIESAESPETALKRELKEELGLNPSCLGKFVPLSQLTHTYDFAIIRLAPFLVYCGERPHMTLFTHTEVRWICLDEARELAWVPADMPILEDLRRSLLHE